MDNSEPKKRFPIGRVARLTFRTFALAMLAACIVGWAVSYFGTFLAAYAPDGNGQVLLFSEYDLVTVRVVDQRGLTIPENARRGWQVGFEHHSIFYRELFGDIEPFRLYFRETDYLRFSVTAPYWFLTALAAMTAALSFKRTWRFTTRQLLIATTAVALLLGAVAWSMRG